MRGLVIAVCLLVAAVLAVPRGAGAKGSGQSSRRAAHAEERVRAEGPPATLGGTGGVITLASPRSSMILVRASTFSMGSTDEEVLAAFADCQREPYGHRCDEEMFSDERPRRRVRLSAYWLDRTEVTVGEYARCVAVGRCRPVPYEQGAHRFDRASLPVSLVTWYEARDYCRFRGARLPTEAEFERAARGLSGRRYPWGLLYNARSANHGRFGFNPSDDRDGYAELAPVAAFPSGRTTEGFMDLAGNVSEWINDRYLPRYLDEDVDDPRGPEPPAAGNTRVVRGGSYESGAAWLRSAARDGAEPETRRPFLGFRCARSDASRAAD